MTIRYTNAGLGRTLITLIILLILVGCGGGGGGGGGGGSAGDSNTLDDPASILGYSAFTLSFSDTPSKGQPLTITLETEGTPSDIVWKLSSQPSGAGDSLAPSVDGMTATITPTAYGEYQIKISAKVDGSEAKTSTNFFITEAFPYDSNKLTKQDPTKDLADTTAIVENQLFVFSDSRSESELRAIVANYPEFDVIGYDDIEGLLIEFDNTSASANASVAALKEETGVDSVVNRVLIGENARGLDFIIEDTDGDGEDDSKRPDDGSAFNDAGDNWHLEKIKAPEAWFLTTGADDFYVGVADGGFYTQHSDMRGRFAEVLNDTSVDPDWLSHGTSAAGTIAAITDNQRGISGINWKTKIIAAGNMDNMSVLKKTINGRNAWVINNSYGFHLDKSFDPTNAAQTQQRLDGQIERTRPDRKAMLKKYSDRLHVWSAGNGVGNGASNSGYYGVDAKYGNGAYHLDDDANLTSKLENLIVVAAMLSDKRLAYYSNFGETVDIAAPTGFKTPAIYSDAGSTYHTFTGTSAATPVVTGAASLLRSIKPELTPSMAKDALVSTASEFVTERYTSSGGPVAVLSHPIPILDMAAAVKYVAEEMQVGVDADPASGWPGDYLFFSSTVTNGVKPYIYEWDFGDGGTSALSSDTHKYDTSRIYTATLTVTDSLGKTATDSIQVRIRGKNTDDYVVWYMDNVRCWDAPRVYASHRDTFNLEEDTCDIPGGGINCDIKVEKVELQGGFTTLEAAQNWFCPQITTNWYHYWCNDRGPRVEIGGGALYTLQIPCDLTDVPYKYP